MSKNTVYQKIPLEEIDMDDRTFSLAPAGSDQLPPELSESIRRYGIIHPPLLLQNDRSHIIISGRMRLIAARDVLGQNYCHCLVLPPETTTAQALALALEDIRLSRPPSPVEEARCRQIAVKALGEEKAMEEFGPRLEITGKLSPAKLAELLELDGEILAALHNGDIDLKIASRLIDIDREDRKELFSIISTLNLSHSNQRKLIDQCRELHKRFNRSVKELISTPECRTIVEHPDANPPQKTALLMNWLNKLCNPRMTAAENDHRSFVANLGLPDNASISHSPSFEKDSLKMTIEFMSRQELEEKWPALKKLISENQ